MDTMATLLLPPQYHQIPVPRLPLIGREADVRDLLARVSVPGTPLVTLTGPGGVGKTRIALEVAAAARDVFTDGVVFVPLASVRDTSRVLSAIGQALGVIDAGDESLLDQVIAELSGLHALMVLDNLEQVLEIGPILARLLADLPHLTLLATSRTRLRLSVEQVCQLAPLTIPDDTVAPADLAATAAVRLFAERAAAVHPDFSLTDDNLAAVVDICRRLDGLPLAIELAAARSSVLPPAVLRDRMQHSFLTTLAVGNRDVEPRHRTMHATIAWSYDLLPAEEQEFLARMSVFVGGFTLDAAETLWDSCHPSGLDALDGAASLVDKSLLRPMDGTEDQPRFHMLETIRTFAREQLDDCTADATVSHHAGWCLKLAEHGRAELLGPDQATWRRRLTVELDNFRAALGWLVEHDPERAARLANALWFFWYAEGYLAEGQRWLELALAAGGTMSADTRATALNNLGNLCYELGDLARTETLYGESLALRERIGDTSGVADSLNNLGMLATALGDHALARERLEASIAMREALGDPHGTAPTMNNLGDVAIAEGDGELARTWNQRALALSRERGNTRRIAHSLHNIGLAHRCLGDDTGAKVLFDSSLQLFQEVGEKSGVAAVLHSLGRVAVRQGDLDAARTAFRRALALHRQVLDRRGLVRSLEGVALVAESTGQDAESARLMSAAATIRGQMVPLQPPVDRHDVEAAEDRVRARLGATAADTMWTTGSTLSRERAIDAALEVLNADAVDAGYAILTRREREVLQLIAVGCSNQEIADRLYISVRTVKSHVTNIFTKLDLASRAAAVAYAHRHHLV